MNGETSSKISNLVKSNSNSSATYSVVTRRKRRLAAEKRNVREASSAAADTAVGLAAASGDQSLQEPSAKQRKEATDHNSERSEEDSSGSVAIRATKKEKNRRAKVAAQKRNFIHSEKGKRNIRRRPPTIISSDSDPNEVQTVEENRLKKKRKGVKSKSNLADSETSSAENPPTSSSPLKHLEKRSASLEEQSSCNNNSISSGGQSGGGVPGAASGISQKRSRKGKEKLPADTTSDSQSGETSRIRRRLSQLTDHLPEVRVPSFRRITRGFAKHLSRSTNTVDQVGAAAEQSSESVGKLHPHSPPKSRRTQKSESSSGRSVPGGNNNNSQASAATTGNTCTNTSCLPGGPSHNTVCPQSDTNMSGNQSGNNPTSNEGNGAENNPENWSSYESIEAFEIGRLQALLEARGLSGHFFSSLGPRMQGLLQRGIHNPMSGKVQSLLASIQAQGDESQQLQAVMELCQLLLMGNEDTLGHSFPMKQAVTALMQLLAMEHNFDIMTHACRALTYMMEALPRSSSVVCEAIPLFLEKLQRIECMDVAEQSLTALEMLSRRHSNAILQAGGVTACLTYVDFFSIAAQRCALNTVANCCSQVSPDKFQLIAANISVLAQRLSMQDKKSVDAVCLCFTRLVDNFQADATKLRQIACDGLLENFKQLLIATPPVLSTATFVSVVRMMHLMCANSSELAVHLLKQNFAETLRFLLLGSAEKSTSDIELVGRTHQELHEIVSLIGEMMPRLPTTGLFSVDCHLRRNVATINPDVIWQWKDDNGTWRPYTAVDCRILETAHQAHEDEININVLGRTYTIDFASMTQINEETGNTRPVQRKCTGHHPPQTIRQAESVDARAEFLHANPGIYANCVHLLFPILFEVYSSSAGPAVRHECLCTMRRMVYHSDPTVLRDVLRNLSVSSHIASMLASQDLKIVVGSLQLAHILMEKLPNVFSVYFRREGVTHQIHQLLESSVVVPSPKKQSSAARDSNNDSFSASDIIAVSGLPIANAANFPFLVSSASGGNLSIPVYGLLSSAAATTGSQTLTSVYAAAAAAAPPVGQTATVNVNISAGTVTVVQSGTTAIPPVMVTAGSGASTITWSPATAMASIPDAAVASNEISQPTSNDAQTGGAMDTTAPKPPKTHKTSITPNAVASKKVTRSTDDSLGPPMTTRRRSSEEKAKVVAASAVDKYQEWMGAARNQMQTRSGQAGRVKAQSIATTTRSKSARNRRDGIVARASVPPAAVPAAAPVAVSTEKSGSGFLSSLPFGRWAKSSNAAGATAPPPSQALSGGIVAPSSNASSSMPHFMDRFLYLPSSYVVQSFQAQQSIVNKEKVREWIKEQAKQLKEKYFVEEAANVDDHPALNVLSRLMQVGEKLSAVKDNCCSCLHELKAIVTDSDVSSFEILHSGLVKALLTYLTDDTNANVSRQCRLKSFCQEFLNIRTEGNRGYIDVLSNPPLTALLAKLNACLNQIEQFAVKVNDSPGGATGNLQGLHALKFFHSHQIKCRLIRHASSTNLRQWKRGPVKIDPLALVSAIERYMLMKGYGRVKGQDDGDQSSDDDEGSEEDVEDALTHMNNQAAPQHRLQFLINDHPLPYNITIYQAVRQYGLLAPASAAAAAGAETDTDNETVGALGYAAIWDNTYSLSYRLLPSGDPADGNASGKEIFEGTSKRKHSSGSSRSSKSPKHDTLWHEGQVPQLQDPLMPYLTDRFPCDVTVKDPSLECLTLLRVLHAVNRYWWTLYPKTIFSHYDKILSNAEFLHAKLTAKANRQLQDPLAIMTGNIPMWLRQIPYACPFLFPFETRQMLFYVLSCDRDRALQRLLDAVPDLLASSDQQDRLTPRLQRKKCTVLRTDLLKQAEKVINEAGASSAVLEVQFKDEVGTGLGPTLEFYTLISKELQKAEHELWRGTKQKLQDNVAKGPTEYITANQGLYPSPMPHHSKPSQTNKMKSKFKFLGKLMARALMDSRMLDLPLASVFYRWLLGEEKEFWLGDIGQLDHDVLKSIQQVYQFLVEKLVVETDPSHTAASRQLAFDNIKVDGTSIEDLDLDFTLIGNPAIELRKGGRDMAVNLDNVEQYLQLMVHWFLFESVSKAMKSFREGFESVFPTSALKMFYPEEFDQLFCGATSQSGSWDASVLAQSIRPDHGYTHDSMQIRWLIEILASYNVEDQRKFLQFVTGSPKLPVGGFKGLSPQLTVVRKAMDSNGGNPDLYLPSVMTCVNYLKLPEYSSIDAMRDRLQIAMQEGQQSFHLS